MKAANILHVAILLFAFGLFPASSKASGLERGNDLFEAMTHCPPTSTMSFGSTPNSTGHDELLCGRSAGFIDGVKALYQHMGLINVPDGVTNGQILDIVFIYLKKNVNQRQELSVVLILKALNESFPNKQPKQ